MNSDEHYTGQLKSQETYRNAEGRGYVSNDEVEWKLLEVAYLYPNEIEKGPQIHTSGPGTYDIGEPSNSHTDTCHLSPYRADATPKMAVKTIQQTDNMDASIGYFLMPNDGSIIPANIRRI